MKVKAINELNSDGKKFQSFVVEIDGVMVNVKVYRRLKNAKETGGKECGKGCPLCTSGTWTVMKFSDPEIKKRSDYKKVWRECFFALELNYNPRDSLCKHGNVELQRDKPCKKCKEEEIRYRKEVETLRRLMKSYGCFDFAGYDLSALYANFTRG